MLVAQQITGLGTINAQREATINSLKQQGLALSDAIAIADAQRAIALARVEAAAEQTLRSLKEENELIHARSEMEAESIKARQTTNRLMDEGVSATTAMAVGSQQLANYADRRARSNRQAAEAAEREAFAMEMMARAAKAAEDAIYGFVPRLAGSLGANFQQSNQGGYSQFNPKGYQLSVGVEYYAILNETKKLVAEMNDPAKITERFNAQFNKALTDTGGNLYGAVGSMIAKGGVFTGGETDPQRLALLDRAINLMSPEQQISSIQGLMGQLQTAPQNLQTAELTKQLGDRLANLTKATEENTSATSAMTDVLSPFYSSDPRATRLGFRAFAGGGIMTQYGAAATEAVSKRRYCDLAAGCGLRRRLDAGGLCAGARRAHSRSRSKRRRIQISGRST